MFLKGEVIKCPHKTDKVCGVECSMHMPNKVIADVTKWKPDPCEGPSCPFSKNMRAAQCVLGPEMIEPFDSKKRSGGPRSVAKFAGNKEKQLAQDPKKPGSTKSSNMSRTSASSLKLEKEVSDQNQHFEYKIDC